MKTRVLIVGAGPVGLTLAIELARYGVPVRIIDRAPARTNKSKALVVWSRTLELLERSGCSQAFVESGFKIDTVSISTAETTVARITFAGLETKYPYALMLPQSETERILEEFLNGLGVKVERSVELIHFTAANDRVTAVLQHALGGQETLATSWLVGCDGAHSTVRHALGMEFHGETMPMDWILADVHLQGLPREPEIAVVWHSAGVLALFPISENRYRVVADVGTVQEDSDRRPDPTLAEVQALLDERFPGSLRAADPVWLSAFRINERKVADYRSGRVFLAGDAAHLHSPAGGQGMNTGMQDACNLAWKLALVVRGIAPERILESYTLERSPVAGQVLKVTGRVTNMATTTNEAIQFLRNHTAALLLGLSPVRQLAADAASELSVGYPDSSLNERKSRLDPAPGRRAPIRANELPVGDGERPRFVLFASTHGLPADLLSRYQQILESNVRTPYHPAGLWLVRPDGYVALAAKGGDWPAVTNYLDKFCAQAATA